MTVRNLLTDLGYKYRLYRNNLPGKPDIALSKIKTVIFINGCFWHQHEGCKRKSTPKSNVKYWSKKLQSNIRKQTENIMKLKSACFSYRGIMLRGR